MSVVVPFFNIEDCVAYCMEALLAQTERDFEVVCIDDGSTDSTAALLDGYAHDPRVRVFHTENGGLSSARNYGVQMARGRYVSFVDGDDLVSPRYLELLLKAMDGSDKRMAVGTTQNIGFTDALAGNVSWENDVHTHKLSHRELVEKCLYEEVKPGAWARLAPRNLYFDNPFPLGRTYEELYMFGSFVDGVEEYVLIDEPIYAYVAREGSIVRVKHAPIKQAFDYVEAIDRLRSYAERTLGPDHTAVAFTSMLQYFRLYRLLASVQDDTETACSLMKTVREYMRLGLAQVMGDARTPASYKLAFAMLAYAPGLYLKLFPWFTKLVRKAG